MTAGGLAKTERALKRFSTLVVRAGVGILLLQAFSIVADGLSRWWFSKPIHGLEDVNGLLIAVVVASFFPAILIERQNIRVTIMGRFVGKRLSGFFDVFGHLVLFIFVAIIAWQFVIYVIASHHQTTLILRLPTAPTMIVTATLIVACVPIQGFVLYTEFLKAMAPPVPEEGAS